MWDTHDDPIVVGWGGQRHGLAILYIDEGLLGQALGAQGQFFRLKQRADQACAAHPPPTVLSADQASSSVMWTRSLWLRLLLSACHVGRRRFV